jgi:hypothetical protein
MKSSTMKIQTLHVKDINYERIPLTLKILENTRNVKREKIIQSLKKNVNLFIYYLLEY